MQAKVRSDLEKFYKENWESKPYYVSSNMLKYAGKVIEVHNSGDQSIEFVQRINKKATVWHKDLLLFDLLICDSVQPGCEKVCYHPEPHDELSKCMSDDFICSRFNKKVQCIPYKKLVVSDSDDKKLFSERIQICPSAKNCSSLPCTHRNPHTKNVVCNGKVRECPSCVSLKEDDTIKSVGKKYDTDKLRWDLLPWDAVQEVVKVLTFGAKKYGSGNWKSVPDAKNRYFSAGMRHRIAYELDKTSDKDSGLHPLAHAICNDLFLLWKYLNEKDN